MRTAFALLAIGLSLVAAPSFAGAPTDADKQEGRERFQRGVELFRNGDYRAALIEFNRANEVAPSYRIQFNIGQTCMELQDYACALRAFDRYLHDGGKDVPKDRVKVVTDDLARLRQLIGTIHIVVNKPDAEVALDDVSVGRSPIDDPVVVGAGRHKITVTLAPLPVVTRVVDVAGGDKAEVSIELAEPVPAPPPPKPIVVEAPPPPPPPPPSPSRAPFWISFALTGAFGAGAAVTGSLALVAKSDLNATAARLGTTSSELGAAQNKVTAFTVTTDALLGATVVAGVFTTVFLFTTKPSKRVGALHVSPGLGSLVLSGTF